MARVKTDLRQFSSRTLDGVPMYPGIYACHWVRLFGVWHLTSIVRMPE